MPQQEKIFVSPINLPKAKERRLTERLLDSAIKAGLDIIEIDFDGGKYLDEKVLQYGKVYEMPGRGLSIGITAGKVVSEGVFRPKKFIGKFNKQSLDSYTNMLMLGGYNAILLKSEITASKLEWLDTGVWCFSSKNKKELEEFNNIMEWLLKESVDSAVNEEIGALLGIVRTKFDLDGGCESVTCRPQKSNKKITWYNCEFKKQEKTSVVDIIYKKNQKSNKIISRRVTVKENGKTIMDSGEAKTLKAINKKLVIANKLLQ